MAMSLNKLKKGFSGKNLGAAAVAGPLGGLVSANTDKYDSIFKTALDPMGLGLGDAVFGKNKGPDYSQYDAEQEAAINAQKAAYDEYINSPVVQYSGGAPLSFEEFSAGNPLSLSRYAQGDSIDYETMSPEELKQLGSSSFDDITTDPRYRDAELSALSSLEERMNGSGLTLQDEADQARLNAQVNTQNRGRLGAIRENMASRGMGGSGMDLLAQLQASQDATELQAYQSLEQAAQAQNQKRQSAIDAGNMGSRLRGQAFSEDAQKAQARDAIERFNVANAVTLQNKNVDTRNQATGQNWQRANETSDRNTGVSNQEANDNWMRANATSDLNTAGRNSTAADNWSRTNATSDRNTGLANGERDNRLNAKLGKEGLSYNWSVDQQNRKMAQDAQEKQGLSDKLGGVFGAAGGIVGGIYGGPKGAKAGYQGGKAVGGAAGNTYYDNGGRSYAHGGMIHGDSYENDDIPIMASEGEIMIPRSIADDPVKASEFVAEEKRPGARRRRSPFGCHAAYEPKKVRHRCQVSMTKIY